MARFYNVLTTPRCEHVLLDERDRLKVADFWLARLLGHKRH
jgi:hypothetical protein